MALKRSGEGNPSGSRNIFKCSKRTARSVPALTAKAEQEPESIAEGKTLYGTHCKSCHGTKGLGDGPKAAQLKTEPGDFATAAFQSQPDCALFYKTSEGRDDMPSFKKKIPDNDERWSIVVYLRSLKK